MIAHIYPSVLQAVSGRGYVGYLDGCFQGYRAEAMQDLGYELRRILIPRTLVNNPDAVLSTIRSRSFADVTRARFFAFEVRQAPNDAGKESAHSGTHYRL